MVWYSSCLVALVAFGQLLNANPVVLERATTSGVSTTPTAALVETTVSGTPTTIEVGAPTATTASTTTSSSSTNGSTDPSAPSATASSTPNAELQSCENGIDQPICEPKPDSKLYVGEKYWVTWNPNVFPLNTTVNIGFQDTNDTTRVAWMSDPTPKQAGFVLAPVDQTWLGDWTSKNFTLVWIAYAIASSNGDPKHKAFDIMVSSKPVEHYPAPAPTPKPSTKSLLIGLPVALGGALLIVVGLYCGFREHRKLGIKGGVYGRRRGYGTGKSRRERMGLKKGAIHLEEMPTLVPQPDYRDDAITPIPPRSNPWPNTPSRPQGHSRELSLGSLVGDNEPNAFRREIQEQTAKK